LLGKLDYLKGRYVKKRELIALFVVQPSKYSSLILKTQSFAIAPIYIIRIVTLDNIVEYVILMLHDFI
jgi:hypothetical protein